VIDYKQVKVGDILQVVGLGMPGFAELGDCVRVTEVEAEGLYCTNSKGALSGVMFTCGAARLEPTQWQNEEEAKQAALALSA